MENKENTTAQETAEETKTEAAAPEQETPAPKPAKEDKGKKEKKDAKKAKEADKDAALKKVQQELDDLTDRYQRMLAEYANYKRRTEKEKEELGAFTKGEMLKALLPSVDNMERAAAAPAGDEYKTGVDMVMRQFEKTLTDLGLCEIEAKDQPFDPECHHAVMREDADGVEADTVTEVFQKGYTFGGKVLRPAMVKVAN